MSDATGTLAMIPNLVKSIFTHGEIMKRPGGLVGKKKRCDERGKSTGNEVEFQESNVYIIERINETGVKWVPTTITKILGQNKPVLIVIYSSKVLSNYHGTSNIQSKRCGELCSTIEELAETRVLDKVDLAKVDIEESDRPLSISHVPTIKLYPGSEAKKNIRWNTLIIRATCQITNDFSRRKVLLYCR